MALVISPKIKRKLLDRHRVSEIDITECFSNRSGKLLEDRRVSNRTDPPTLWFIAETDYGRQLKIVFVQVDNGDIHIKTAYEPNPEEIRIYNKYSV